MKKHYSLRNWLWALALPFFLLACDKEDDGAQETAKEDGLNIVEIAQQTEDLTNLVAALTKADEDEGSDLIGTLSGEGPFTVFAPTDDAFGALLGELDGFVSLEDFDTGDASSGDTGPRLPVAKVFGMMLRNPIIMTIACVEFCSGFLRQSIMQWYRTFAKQTDGVLGLADSFVYENWGMLLCAAGILGGVLAGVMCAKGIAAASGLPIIGVNHLAGHALTPRL